MKWVSILVPFVFSFAHAQQSTTLTVSQPKATQEAELALDAAPNAQIRIGRSAITAGGTYSDKVTGQGLTIGGRYDFTPTIGVNGEFTSFRTDIDEGSGVLTDSTEVIGVYGEFTAIHYDQAGYSIDGSILAGLLSEPMTSNSHISGLLYGAAVSADFDKKIGVRLDTKVGRDLVSMTSLSLVGYY